MSEPFHLQPDGPKVGLVACFDPLDHPPNLLPGECLEHYESLRRMIISEVAPQSGIEWLWTIDLVELSWDIQRYRALRYKVLEAYRQKAVEAALLRVDGVGIP